MNEKARLYVISPAFFMNALFVVGYIIGNIRLVHIENLSIGQAYPLLLIEFTGIIIFNIGYFYNKEISGKTSNIINMMNRYFRVGRASPKTIIMAYTISWAGRLFALHRLSNSAFSSAKYEYGRYENITATLSIVTELLYILAISYIFKNVRERLFSKKWLILAYLLLVTEIIYTLLRGWKASFINPMIEFIIPYHFLYKRIRLFRGKTIIYMLIGIIMLSILFPIISNYRIQVIRGQNEFNKPDFLSSMAKATYDYFNNEYSSASIWDNLTKIIDRMNYSSSFYYLYSKIEKIGYFYGRTFLPIVTWIIPRALWQNKPSNSIGGWFARDILDWQWDTRGEGAITYMGDFYLNYGYIGVMILMFVLGMFFRYIFRMLNPQSGDLNNVILYTIFIMQVIMRYEQNFTNAIIGLIYNNIVYIFVLLILMIPRKRTLLIHINNSN
jgi:oligosaccharide repeat unit polymerase